MARIFFLMAYKLSDVQLSTIGQSWLFIIIICKNSSSALHCMGMLLYLFCDGKTEDNLLGIFNLFDEDGNGTISIDELLNMMAFFIEIGDILLTL